jgi:hypothetical protein
VFRSEGNYAFDLATGRILPEGDGRVPVRSGINCARRHATHRRLSRRHSWRRAGRSPTRRHGARYWRRGLEPSAQPS